MGLNMKVTSSLNQYLLNPNNHTQNRYDNEDNMEQDFKLSLRDDQEEDIIQYGSAETDRGNAIVSSPKLVNKYNQKDEKMTN